MIYNAILLFGNLQGTHFTETCNKLFELVFIELVSSDPASMRGFSLYSGLLLFSGLVVVSIEKDLNRASIP